MIDWHGADALYPWPAGIVLEPLWIHGPEDKGPPEEA